MYEQTLQEATSLDYPIQTPSTPSTGIEEIDLPDTWESLLFSLIRKEFKKQFYYNLFPLFEVNLSSIKPHFEIKNETSLIEESFRKVEQLRVLEDVSGILNELTPQEMKIFEEVVKRRSLFK